MDEVMAAVIVGMMAGMTGEVMAEVMGVVATGMMTVATAGKPANPEGGMS